jgi:hypothetical protein
MKKEEIAGSIWTEDDWKVVYGSGGNGKPYIEQQKHPS